MWTAPSSKKTYLLDVSIIIYMSIIQGFRPGTKQWRKLNMKQYQWQTWALKTLKKQSKFKKHWEKFNFSILTAHLQFIFGRPFPISDHILKKWRKTPLWNSKLFFLSENCPQKLKTYGSLDFFFSAVLTAQNSPELQFFIDSCIQWSVVLYLGLGHIFF